MPLWANLISSFLWSLLTSRAGQIAMAFCIAWGWSGWKADNYWKLQIATSEAAREAAYHKEIIRQEEAAREIATESAARAEENSRAQNEMRRIIQEFNSREPVYVEKKVIVPGSSNCHIDNIFSGVVRDLDAQARKSKASRRPR